MFGNFFFIFLTLICFSYSITVNQTKLKVEANKNCTFTNDSSILNKLAGKLFLIETSNTSQYYFSVCGFVFLETLHVKDTVSSALIIQKEKDNLLHYEILNTTNTTKRGREYLLAFSNAQNNHFHVILRCDAKAKFMLNKHIQVDDQHNVSEFIITHPNLCVYALTARSVLSMLFIGIIVLVILYLLVGFVIRKTVCGLTWYESIPHVHLINRTSNRAKRLFRSRFSFQRGRPFEPKYAPIPQFLNHTDFSTTQDNLCDKSNKSNNDHGKFIVKTKLSAARCLTAEDHQLLSQMAPLNDEDEDDVMLLSEKLIR